MVRSNTLISTFGLLAMSSALPTASSPSSLQQRTWIDCPRGTSYFKCFDNDGCFSSDPCIKPPTQTQSTLDKRVYTDCPSGTSYFKCFNNDGCFSSDPYINPPTVAKAVVPVSSTLKTRWQDCPAGTSYFKCFDKDGCFASDPCINPPTKSTSTPVPSATPTATITSGTTTQDQRSMYVVTPDNANDKSQKVSYFQVQSGQMDINQAGVFTGIPATATQCWLGWNQAAKNQRDFSVTGNGRVSAVQLDKLDTSNGVSWSDVTKANVISAEFGPDFTGWDLVDGASTHGSWPLKCAETIYLNFETHKGAENVGVNDPRNIFMEQDEKNGWDITWS